MYTHYIKWLHGFQIWHILSLHLWRKYHTNVSSNKCTPFVQPFRRLWFFTIQESRLFRQMSKQSVVWKILLWHLPSAASTDMVYSGSVLLFLTGLIWEIWVYLSPFSCLQELFAVPLPLSGMCCVFFAPLFCDKRLLISCFHTAACTCAALSSAPLGFPDLKSKHTAFALSHAVLWKKQLFAWIFNGAHIATPLKQMRVWRITSIPDLSCFKSRPLQNVTRLVHWVHHSRML